MLSLRLLCMARCSFEVETQALVIASVYGVPTTALINTSSFMSPAQLRSQHRDWNMNIHTDWELVIAAVPCLQNCKLVLQCACQ